jgi:putative oxidoreductase
MFFSYCLKYLLKDQVYLPKIKQNDLRFMNAFLSLGRWFFPIPFALFGLMHFMDTQAMADFVVPDYMPAKAFFVYLAGAGLIAAGLSMLLGKFDKLAAVLLAVFLLTLVFLVHAPKAMAHEAGSAVALSNMIKDLALAGAALLYAGSLAKDKAVIG